MAAAHLGKDSGINLDATHMRDLLQSLGRVMGMR